MIQQIFVPFNPESPLCRESLFLLPYNELAVAQGPKILTIYLSRVLCLSVSDCVCVCVTIAERSAILLVLVIKLTKETRRLV